MSWRIIEIKILFLDVLSVIALAVGQAEIRCFSIGPLPFHSASAKPAADDHR